MELRAMKPKDWHRVSAIYAEGIATGFATFETQVPPYEDWDRAHLKDFRVVAIEDEHILGWAALSPVSGRCVYGGVAEVSVYIGQSSRGMGVGKRLMEALITQSEAAGFWTLQSGIFPENTSSIKLHERMGFRFIGARERVGQLHGVWKDNLLYERRSKRVGVD
ncbi:N-acetyltransferase family protein [Flavobacteriaceae bacterium 3-367]